MSDFAPSTQAGSGLDPRKRVNYQVGLVLGEDEFRQDQLYFRSRDHLATRALHGYGTVAGLAVSFDEASGELRVQPGLAVDPLGRLICVPVEYCAQLNAWLTKQLDEALAELPGDVKAVPGPHDLYVVLCYAECATDEVPVPSESCLTAEDSRAASRLLESFELKIVAVAPEPVNELADDEISTAVGAIMDLLDPDAPDPPDFDDVAGAVRAWAVERRPEVNAGAACIDGADVCVPLATVTLKVAEAGDGNRRPDGPVAVDDADRPILLSTRFLQEALLRSAPSDHEHTYGELSDVDLTGLRHRDIMWYHGASGTWQRRSFLHRHAPHNHGLGDLKDVDLSDPEPEEGFVLTFDGKGWVSDKPESGAGDHGALDGLGDDDHKVYLPHAGSRPMTGNLNLDGNRIVNVPPSAGANQPVVHTQAAEGDLAGSYPAPTVDGIRGSPVVGDTAPGDALIFRLDEELGLKEGAWVPGIPTILPFATITFMGVDEKGLSQFEVWLHLEIGRLDAFTEELDPATFTVFAEIAPGTAVTLQEVGVESTTTLQRNAFLVSLLTPEVDAERVRYLRWEFRMEEFPVRPRQGVRIGDVSLLEWARTAGIWFIGQGRTAEDLPAVTVYALDDRIRQLG